MRHHGGRRPLPASRPPCTVRRSRERRAMDVLRPAVMISPALRQRADSPESPEVELIRLQEQVAWLRAERAALWWAVGHDELTGLANRRLFSTLAPSIVHGSRPA